MYGRSPIRVSFCLVYYENKQIKMVVNNRQNEGNRIMDRYCVDKCVLLVKFWPEENKSYTMRTKKRPKNSFLPWTRRIKGLIGKFGFWPNMQVQTIFSKMAEFKHWYKKWDLLTGLAIIHLFSVSFLVKNIFSFMKKVYKHMLY